MTAESMLMGAIGAAFAVFWCVRSFGKAPNRPDPWESEMSEDDLEAIDTPVCVHCLTPIEDFKQHYCSKCGHVTGEFTRYIPFVNIRFNYSLFGTLWRKVRSSATPLSSKVSATILIIGFLACGLGILLGCLIPG